MPVGFVCDESRQFSLAFGYPRFCCSKPRRPLFQVRQLRCPSRELVLIVVFVCEVMDCISEQTNHRLKIRFAVRPDQMYLHTQTAANGRVAQRTIRRTRLDANA